MLAPSCAYKPSSVVSRVVSFNPSVTAPLVVLAVSGLLALTLVSVPGKVWLPANVMGMEKLLAPVKALLPEGVTTPGKVCPPANVIAPVEAIFRPVSAAAFVPVE